MNSLTRCLFCGAAFLFSPVLARAADSAAIPEIARLAKVLVGDWNTVEIVQHGKPVPDGAGSRGAAHVTVTGGRSAVASEGHSDVSVGGEWQGFMTVWWRP